MGSFKKIAVVLVVGIFLTGLGFYFGHQLLHISTKLASSDQTMRKTDSMRIAFKVIVLNQQAMEEYLLALKNDDEDRVYDALDLTAASLGFINSEYVDNKSLLQRVAPLVRQNQQLIESNLLGISDEDLQNLVNNLQALYREAESIERNIWIDFQKDYIGFQTNEFELQLVYQVIAALSLFSLLFLSWFYYRQRVLNRAYQQSQNALIDSERQLRDLVETTSVVTWEMDADSQRFTYMSPQIEALTGFDRRQWIDFDYWAQRLHPQDRAEATDLCLGAASKGKDHAFEYRMKNRQGETIWIRDIVTVVKKQDKPVVLRGYFIDITETKKAELSLQQKERWLSQVMHALPNGVQECDVEGKITYSNSAHHHLLGLEEGELPGHYVWDFIAGDKRKMELRDYLKKLAKEQPEPEPYQAKNLTQNGRLIDVEVIWDYQRNDSGVVSGFISIISDITERKKIENQLLESERTLANAQKIAHMGNWQLELETNQLNWSDEVFRIFEIDQDKFAASYEAFIDAIHPQDRDLVNKAYADSVSEGTPYEIRHRLLMKDGRIKSVLERGETEYDKDGKPLRSVGIVMDISELERAKQLSEQSEGKFQAMTEQSSDGITVADEEGNYIFVNSTFCDMVGYSEQELLQMTVFDVKAPEQDQTSFARTKGAEQGLEVRVELQRKDGSTFTSEVVGKMIEFDGQPRVLGTIRDISERIKAEKALAESQQRYDLALEVANDGVWDWHLEDNVTIFDKRYYTMAGYEPDAFPCSFEEWHKRIHPQDVKQAEEAVQLYLSGQSQKYDVEFRFLRQDGEYMWIRARGKIVERDQAGKPLRFVGTHSDISVLKEHENHILRQAHYDSLTGLPNRFLTLDRLTQLLNEAGRNEQQVAVLFMDLDDFKKVNDTLGHEIGDKLLVETAERLSQTVRSRDTVGRLGGDEFIILMGGVTDASDTLSIAENVLNRLRDAYHIEGRELILSGSLGIALYPQDGETPSELLRNADSAMYHAKDLGRNTYSFFTQAMNEEVSRRLEIEEQIHGALGRGEFSVMFQPKINVNDRQVIGAEALLRWNNPALGEVSPIEFIPIAEQSGLISSLGQFVLAEALTQAASWQKQRAGFQIAVNLSPVQFRDPELVNMVDRHIEQYGIDSSTLELEITEGVLMSGHSYIDEALAGLKQLGVSIAMDDFGTGYSSLGYLRNYPFDVLKIDKSFIRDITLDPDDKELINAAVALAHGLNLKVVAEGVETEEQFEYLESIGCDYAQGYLFSKPLLIEQFAKLLRS